MNIIRMCRKPSSEIKRIRADFQQYGHYAYPSCGQEVQFSPGGNKMKKPVLVAR